MPPGIVTRDVAEAGDFARTHGRVVAERNRSYGGRGVARIWRELGRWWIEPVGGMPEAHDALEAILERLFAADPDPYEFVRYLDNVGAGDKRVLVVEGEVYGAILRRAPVGGWANNLHAGATVHRATVTPIEEAVVAATWRSYHDRGLDLLGYDFLVDDNGEPTLSEINAGNVGGYGALEETDGVPVYARLLDWIAALVGQGPA